MRKPIKPIKLKTIIDSALFKEIRALIMAARKAVVRNIDTIQVMTSFEIGRNFYLAYCDRLPEKCQMASGKLICGQKNQALSEESGVIERTER